MPLINFMREMFRLEPAPALVNEQRITTVERRRQDQQRIVEILRDRSSASRQKHIDWLKQRRDDIGGDSGTIPDDGGSQDSGVGEPMPTFPGKMPIRASTEALALIKSLKTDEGFDRIQFPQVFHNDEKIVALKMSDRSQDKVVGTVKVEYETDVNPASLDRLGVTLDLDQRTHMLSCVVLYPAIPTGLASRTQPSSVGQ